MRKRLYVTHNSPACSDATPSRESAGADIFTVLAGNATDGLENSLRDAQFSPIPEKPAPELSSDTSGTVDAVVHACDELLLLGRRYDVLVLL